MINILPEIIKTLQEKVLRTINLNWLQNESLEKNNSVNGHLNKPWIVGRFSSYLLSSKTENVENDIDWKEKVIKEKLIYITLKDTMTTTFLLSSYAALD